MSDRTDRLIVVLEQDYRDENLAAVVEAIRMIRGVLHVESVTQDPGEAFTATTRAKSEMRELVYKLLKEIR